MPACLIAWRVRNNERGVQFIPTYWQVALPDDDDDVPEIHCGNKRDALSEGRRLFREHQLRSNVYIRPMRTIAWMCPHLCIGCDSYIVRTGR